jgi:pimeloyl-ACP methyl ester carboxylesterase
VGTEPAKEITNQMNIYFFHGKESTPTTSHTATAIRAAFEGLGETVYVPDYEPMEHTYEEIVSYIKGYVENASAFEENVFIGISLGGYWALQAANMVPFSSCILLNPSIGYYGTFDLASIKSALPISVFVNKDDVVVDPVPTITRFAGRAWLNAFEVGGHRMTNIEEIMPLIINAAYSSEVM